MPASAARSSWTHGLLLIRSTRSASCRRSYVALRGLLSLLAVSISLVVSGQAASADAVRPGATPAQEAAAAYCDSGGDDAARSFTALYKSIETGLEPWRESGISGAEWAEHAVGASTCHMLSFNALQPASAYSTPLSLSTPLHARTCAQPTSSTGC
jgi:hypothetical protein